MWALFPKGNRTRSRFYSAVSRAGKRFSSHTSSVNSVFPSGIGTFILHLARPRGLVRSILSRRRKCWQSQAVNHEHAKVLLRPERPIGASWTSNSQGLQTFQYLPRGLQRTVRRKCVYICYCSTGSEDSDSTSMETSSASRTSEIHLAKISNMPKKPISILQTLWEIVTLWRMLGDRIALFGYGAFGLTVAPYAIMSIVNLATVLLRSEYTDVHLIHWCRLDSWWLIVGSVSSLWVRFQVHTGKRLALYEKAFSCFHFEFQLSAAWLWLGRCWKTWDSYFTGLIVEQLTCSRRRQGLERTLGEWQVAFWTRIDKISEPA